MAQGSYSPNDVSVIVGGTIISGFADGTFVDWSQDKPTVESMQGADGAVALMIRRSSVLATLKLTLLQTSMANNLMTSLFESQRIPGNPVVGFPVQILNAQGLEAVNFPAAAIKQFPSISYENGIATREWELTGIAEANVAGYAV